MAAVKLGQLKKVDIRKAFPTEWNDFTPWLAKDENLALLADELGLELELVEREKPIGKYRLDLLCKNTKTGAWIAIENQFSETDHSHLGQLLTYAAGLPATAVVWIAESLSDEHKAVLDWLNNNMLNKAAFFGIEIEVWQIDESAYAPKFNVRCQPNNWNEIVQEFAVGASANTELKQVQYRFWTTFRKYMEEKKSAVKCQSAGPRNWMDHPIGNSYCHLSSVILSAGKAVSDANGPALVVSLTIQGQKRFDAIQAYKAQVENQLGTDLIWYKYGDNKTCYISQQKPADFHDEKLWPQQHAWLKETLEKFQKAFVPIIKDLDHTALND